MLSVIFVSKMKSEAYGVKCAPKFSRMMKCQQYRSTFRGGVFIKGAAVAHIDRGTISAENTAHQSSKLENAMDRVLLFAAS